jgi:hypothetical protein
MKYTKGLIRTTKDTKILINVLSNIKYNSLRWYAVRNPNCPPEILVEILKGKNNSLSSCASQNPNCPPEILAEILERKSDDDVSYCASRNPNCPKNSKIKWENMIDDIGKIKDYFVHHPKSLSTVIEAQKMISEVLVKYKY